MSLRHNYANHHHPPHHSEAETHVHNILHFFSGSGNHNAHICFARDAGVHLYEVVHGAQVPDRWEGTLEVRRPNTHHEDALAREEKPVPDRAAGGIKLKKMRYFASCRYHTTRADRGDWCVESTKVDGCLINYCHTRIDATRQPHITTSKVQFIAQTGLSPHGVIGHGPYSSPPNVSTSEHDVEHCAHFDPYVSRMPTDSAREKNIYI